MEKFKPVSLLTMKFEDSPLVSLTGFNFQLAAFSNDLKYMAVARCFRRNDTEIRDIVLVKLKNMKESILVDTQTMIRYGRPNGYLYDLYFNEHDQLIAKIGDGMEGVTLLTLDPDKNEIVKDEYIADYGDDDEEEGEEEDELYYDRKIADLKRIFPKKTNLLLSDLTYKLFPTDSAGYLVQGILPNDNSIFYLSHGEGKLRLIHNISDPKQIDNIDGVWGTSFVIFYFLKDKQNDYLFKYDIKTNIVTLLEKYPLHSHFTYISSYDLKNRDTLLSFEVENKSAEVDESLALFRYHKGNLSKIEDYPLLQEVKYIHDKNLLLLYYIKSDKRCLDVRLLN